jgi:hypothetical protein
VAKVNCKGVILCDEIRQEATGKYIILGVYSGGVVVPALPSQIALSLYVMAEFEATGEQTLMIQVVHGDNTAIMGVILDVPAANYPIAVPTPKLPITLTDESDLVVSIGLSADELELAARFPVSLNPDIWTLFPNGIQQPDEQSLSDAEE